MTTIRKVLKGTLYVSLAASIDGALSESSDVLSDLNSMLQEARGLPAGQRAVHVCPDGLEAVIGMPMARVLGALPPPDYEHATAVSYLISSPGPPHGRGGGFPEITFYAKDELVERVTCSYSR